MDSGLLDVIPRGGEDAGEFAGRVGDQGHGHVHAAEYGGPCQGGGGKEWARRPTLGLTPKEVQRRAERETRLPKADVQKEGRGKR